MSDLSIPERLFKYVTYERLDVLKNECIRFTQPAALNDPWEMKPYLENLLAKDVLEDQVFKPLFERPIEQILDECLESKWREFTPATKAAVPGGLAWMKHMARQHLKNDPQSFDEFLAETRIEMQDTIKRINPEGVEIFNEALCDHFGILSLTPNPHNLLMWGHYTANHTGMVIEFNTNHEFFNAHSDKPDALSGPMPVVYASHRPALKSIYDLVELEEMPGANEWEPLVLTKSQDWAYEKEWRMVRVLDRADEVLNTVDPSVHLFRLPASCISALILGARMSEPHIQGVREFLKTDSRYAHVSLSQAKISRRTFDLEIQPLK